MPVPPSLRDVLAVDQSQTKRMYRWYAPDGYEFVSPPAYEELPDLPREWIDALRVDAAHNGAELLPVSDVVKPF